MPTPTLATANYIDIQLTMVALLCDTGYYRGDGTTSGQVTCMDDGSWDANDFVCQKCKNTFMCFLGFTNFYKSGV
jgi:hypothetical protein